MVSTLNNSVLLQDPTPAFIWDPSFYDIYLSQNASLVIYTKYIDGVGLLDGRIFSTLRYSCKAIEPR